MNILRIILPVLVGSLIGYCTNYLAIKMLFHPYRAVSVGKWRLPFTPGIIPKNQSRVANSLGEAVSEQLLSKDILMENFLRDDAGKKMIMQLVSGVCDSSKPIAEWLPGGETQEELIDTISTLLSKSIMEKAGEIDLEPVISGIGEEALEPLIASKPIVAMFLNDSLKAAVYERLSDTMLDYLNRNGEEILKQFVTEYLEEMGEKPFRETFHSGEDREKLQSLFSDLIEQLILHYSDTLLEQINVKEITRQRIEDMKVEEVEHLVLSVMKKELQAVINLGAVIGAVIGTINIFF